MLGQPCRHVATAIVYNRDQFIHGNGPRAQVCVRCGVEKLVTEAEAAHFTTSRQQMRDSLQLQEDGLL